MANISTKTVSKGKITTEKIIKIQVGLNILFNEANKRRVHMVVIPHSEAGLSLCEIKPVKYWG